MPTQVIVHAPYDVRFEETPSIERPLGDFELLVRAEVGALSPGTEARIYSGRGVERFSYRVSYPFLCITMLEKSQPWEARLEITVRAEGLHLHATPE
jgi:hypothetical protein